MLLGVAFLLGTLTGISRFSILLSFSVMVIGSMSAVLAIKLNRMTLRRSLYLFFATFFILVGFFLFLSALNILPVPFSRAWPMLSIISGIALFPMGWQHYRSFRPRYIVPSIAFIMLGCILLIFSLDIVPFSLTQFVRGWWPLLVALAGLILVLLSIGTRNNTDSTSTTPKAAPHEPTAPDNSHDEDVNGD
jgi:predicted neutral ceramidase superfamily lipid hydrolase